MVASQVSSPYIGLIPYDRNSAQFFFGRAQEVQRITANMFAARLTLAYGPTGVGKSSILRAGVASRWRGRSDLLLVICSHWQYDPVEAVKAAIIEAVACEIADFEPPNQRLPLEQFLVACVAQVPRRLMIVLDQFEEFFLYHPYDTTLSTALRTVMFSSALHVSILISLREEAVGKLERFRDDLPELFDHIIYIRPLTRRAARQAINEPLRVYNEIGGEPFTIEAELVESILDQVETGQVKVGVLRRGAVAPQQMSDEQESHSVETSYLQMVLLRLWREAQLAGLRDLNLQILNDLGGVINIIESHLDQVMVTLTNEEQGLAAKAFRILVTPSGSKIAHTAKDIATYSNTELGALETLLEKLAKPEIRILRSVAPPLDLPSERRYEIFHDMLAPSVLDWSTRYIEAEVAEIAIREAEIERKRATAEARFQEQVRFARRLRKLVVTGAILLLLTASTAVFALFKSQEARIVQEIAENEHNRAEAAAERAETNLKTAKVAEDNAMTARAQAAVAEKTARAARLQAETEKERANNLLRLATREKQRANWAGTFSQLFQEAFTLSKSEQGDEAIKRYEKGLDLAKRIGDRPREASILSTLGVLYGHRPEARASYEKAQVIYHQTGEKLLEADTLFSIGSLFQDGNIDFGKSETPLAEPYFLQALELYRNLGHRSGVIKTLEELGRRYEYEGPDGKRKAIAYYNQLLDLYKETKDYKRQAETLIKLRSLHVSFLLDGQEKYKKEKEFYQLAAEAYSIAGDIGGKAEMLKRIGMAHEMLGDTSIAISFYEKATALFEQAGMRSDAVAAQISVGDLRLKSGNQQAAIESYENARSRFDNSEEVGRYKRIVLRQLISLYERSGVPEKAAAVRAELDLLDKPIP